MKNLLKIIILIIAILVLTPPAFANEPVEYLVKFKPQISEQARKFHLLNYDSEEIGNKKIGIYKAKGGQDLKDTLLKNKDIEYVVPNYKRKIFMSPNDALYPQQWDLVKMNLPSAWDITTGSTTTTVAVLDTGIDITHPDLSGKLIAGYNAADGNTNYNDTAGHGTHVSGTIGAIGNNNIGVSGVSWLTKIMPVKVFRDDGSCYDSDIINGITYAVDNGAKVINMSLGGPDNSQALQNAVDYAMSHNVIVIAAAGNDGTSVLNYPAACTGVVGVGSTNSQDIKSSFSQYNQSVAVTAPGESIVSTFINESYATGSGTSMAAPHVSGLASLILAINPNLTAMQVINIIENTSVDLGAPGRDDYYGYGRIDAYSAVKKALSTLVTINSLSPSKTSPQTINTPITWSCSASGGTSLRYQFWTYTAPTGWQVAQAYSSTNTFTWTPTTAGDYLIGVWVKDSASPNDLDKLGMVWYTIQAAAPVTLNSLSPNKSSPQTVNTPITWTCNASGGTSLRYQFWTYTAPTGWQVAQAYSSTNTFTWTPTTAGDYLIGVWVKDSASPNDLDKLGMVWYTIQAAAPVTLNSLSPNKSSPQTINTPITWSCSASGGTSLRYQFWTYTAPTGWQVAQAYSSTNTFTWTPTTAGDYLIGVWVKDSASPNDLDKLGMVAFTIQAAAPVTLNSLSPNKISPLTVNTPITWTCSASGGTSLRYQFWTYTAPTGWQVAQAYSSTNTFTWTPTTAGDYLIGVWVKDSASPNDFDKLGMVWYTIQAAAPVTLNSLSPNKSSP